MTVVYGQALVVYPELTYLEWRCLDGTVLQSQVLPPGHGRSGLLDQHEDYELYVRPASSKSWLCVFRVEPRNKAITRFDL